MKVEDLMTRHCVVKLDENESVLNASKTMKNNDVGTVLATKNGELSGILVDRQIVCKCLADGLDPQQTKIKEIMTENPRTGKPDMDVAEAIKILGESKFRRLPIVEDGKPVGILSVADLAVHIRELMDLMFEEISKSKKKEQYYYQGEEVKARKK